ncbi:Hypothetical Protein RradSPS_0050 [Rubrobacter radiotolerans]|uniref:DUF4190 domain-containing protein n=1 Tax=Rubrobacter radiotolerans TaxID=42256 RepID=A0A023WZ19_RUBRA|nr:DUF4190 domain-containing protein [Rubrobacter radiotolerans]AHY45333.1 Hypothetical Protein RradSPS_0050 [Rubrobacter radiotolerans]MDX5892744.1 DUF4190 domain-containing protein [Rubrobacter radiotolerans]SMC02403.1 hypothetical protein SAMN00767673_0052 [Rubrobacter radiotolerans DSM 5868]
MEQGPRDPADRPLGRENPENRPARSGDSGYRDRTRGEEPGFGREGGGRPTETDRSYGDRSYEERGGTPYREPEKTGTGWGIAALVLAGLSIIAAFFFAFFNLILAVPGLILGIVARRRGSRGMGLTAIILSIVGILLGILITVAVGALIFTSPEFQQIIQEAQ